MISKIFYPGLLLLAAVTLYAALGVRQLSDGEQAVGDLETVSISAVAPGEVSVAAAEFSAAARGEWSPRMSERDMPSSAPAMAQQDTAPVDQSTQLLRLIIENTTPFSAEDVRRIQDPVAFVDRLNRIVEGNYYESEYLQNPLSYQPVEFIGGDMASMAFPGNSSKVFINFRMEGYSGNAVLVKWYNPNTGEILGLKKYPIVPEESYHPIWLENRSEWQAGQYNVEVYSADESLQLISAGVYQVADL